MASLLLPLRANANYKLFLIEFLAVFLWVTSTLFAYFLTATPLLHSLSPSIRSLHPAYVFYSLLVALMAIWEIFGLALGSTFNPCVTISLTLAGETAPIHAIVVIFAQFLAHIAAAFVVRICANILHKDIDGIFHPPQPHKHISYSKAVVIEALITALLCVVALSLKHIFHEKATFKKWSLMTMLVVAVLDVAGEWTGGCMNPAMSFALAVLEGHWAAHSVYWVGPMVGAVVAACMYNNILRTRRRGIRERMRARKDRAATKKI
ncbi:unnamed protein product [Chondrus crispus]|uniref:Aquaporin n=1 Tax=Chondrus crispus TaxID=2769 RepID=R7Q3W0_CHOCR|nr:unnamed protein product [Chondrus crispus]CDF32548.1 unnamed protein product [Chondrus crispus]|eukprot:XP_005712213.1 unnamed protein product [Chondrus crispus]